MPPKLQGIPETGRKRCADPAVDPIAQENQKESEEEPVIKKQSVPKNVHEASPPSSDESDDESNQMQDSFQDASLVDGLKSQEKDPKGHAQRMHRFRSRNLKTVIHNDDPNKEPDYFADMSMDMERNGFNALLHNSGQTEPFEWKQMPEDLINEKMLKKLGEGSYGEVYATNWCGGPVAIKVVPFEESEDTRKYTGDYNGGAMPTADTILPELLIMKELSALNDFDLPNSTPTFIDLETPFIVQGPCPSGFRKAWHKYADEKTSLNTSPDDYASKDQLFMLFVTEYGGVALENFKLKNEKEIGSILMQLLMALTVAENALNFEHRDLHLGNVLIDRNGVEELYFKIGGRSFTIQAKGVKVNIIDFTLSRIYKDGCAVFMDLEQDPELFEEKGDPQYDVYRRMREVIGGDWKTHSRKTNLLWVQHIALQMLNNKDICPRMSRDRKEYLRSYFEKMSEFGSCIEYLMEKGAAKQMAILKD